MRQPKDDPDPIDLWVGSRVRVARKTKGVTQVRLAEAIGISFQQVQKYERGKNRISISMLAHIAEALDTTIFELMDEVAGQSRLQDEVSLLAAEPGALELLRAFARVPPGAQRQALLDLVGAAADAAVTGVPLRRH